MVASLLQQLRKNKNDPECDYAHWIENGPNEFYRYYVSFDIDDGFMCLHVSDVILMCKLRSGGCSALLLTRYSFVTYSIVRNPWSSLIPLSRGSFDVIVGMDWLSKRKFVRVCQEKVVRIPLEGNEILRVHGERAQGVVKTLMKTKLNPYFLTERDEVWSWGAAERKRLSRTLKYDLFMTLPINRMDKILATSSEASRLKERAAAIAVRDSGPTKWKNREDDDAVGRKVVSDTIGFEYLASASSKPDQMDKSPVLWAEIGESSLIGPELVQETTDKVVLIKEKLKAARDHQKSYADNRHKPLEFEVGDRVMLTSVSLKSKFAWEKGLS
ncbi:hypothetical protein Tco_1501411 [Tanacetum coccineum]